MRRGIKGRESRECEGGFSSGFACGGFPGAGV